jgi:hypothetical protein
MLIAGACQAQSFDPWDKRWSAFEVRLKSCSASHGYDPATAEQLADHVLGEGELDWRECAYEGLREIMASGSPAEYAYRRLISEDRRITKEVVAGKLTRSQRKERILDYLGQIQAKEEEGREMQALDKERDAFLGRVNELKRMRQLERRMR